MYKLFELFGTKWIEVLNVRTLEEIKAVLPEESKREGLNSFRIDKDEIPLTFCRTDEHDIKYCIENLDRIEAGIMYMHNAYDKSYHKVASSRPSKYEKEVKVPKKTTKKHLKRMRLSNKRRKRFYH